MSVIQFFIQFLGVAFILLLYSAARSVDLTVSVAFQFCKSGDGRLNPNALSPAGLVLGKFPPSARVGSEVH